MIFPHFSLPEILAQKSERQEVFVPQLSQQLCSCELPLTVFPSPTNQVEERMLPYMRGLIKAFPAISSYFLLCWSVQAKDLMH